MNSYSFYIDDSFDIPEISLKLILNDGKELNVVIDYLHKFFDAIPKELLLNYLEFIENKMIETTANIVYNNDSSSKIEYLNSLNRIKLAIIEKLNPENGESNG